MHYLWDLNTDKPTNLINNILIFLYTISESFNWFKINRQSNLPVWSLNVKTSVIPDWNLSLMCNL